MGTFGEIKSEEVVILDNRILVTQSNVASTLGGVIDPLKEYFIDGIINCAGISVEIPAGGIYISGYNFNLSKIICADASFTMFTSPVGGSGDVLITDIGIEITGVGSKVYDLVSLNGLQAIEIDKVNYNNCTSRGVIDNYRQGLETGTGYFGGTPELTLKGVWVGGFFIETSIVRNLTDGSYSLFKAGVGFLMSSRFRSNQNIDLPASASFFDFSPSNFVNPSTVDITELIITRNGVFDSEDANLTPNMSKGDLVANWTNNNGLPNTFVGGTATVTTEVATVINTIGVYETLNATLWTATNLEHFDNPSGSQLRHLGNTPREYKITADFTIESSANNELVLRIKKWDNSLSVFVTVHDQRRPVNNLQGGRDVAFFNININTILNENDYIFLEISNQTSTANVTAENDSYYIIEKR